MCTGKIGKKSQGRKQKKKWRHKWDVAIFLNQIFRKLNSPQSDPCHSFWSLVKNNASFYYVPIFGLCLIYNFMVTSVLRNYQCNDHKWSKLMTTYPSIQPCDFFCPQVSLNLVVHSCRPGDTPTRKEALGTTAVISQRTYSLM